MISSFEGETRFPALKHQYEESLLSAAPSRFFTINSFDLVELISLYFNPQTLGPCVLLNASGLSALLFTTGVWERGLSRSSHQ